MSKRLHPYKSPHRQNNFELKLLYHIPYKRSLKPLCNLHPFSPLQFHPLFYFALNFPWFSRNTRQASLLNKDWNTSGDFHYLKQKKWRNVSCATRSQECTANPTKRACAGVVIWGFTQQTFLWPNTQELFSATPASLQLRGPAPVPNSAPLFPSVRRVLMGGETEEIAGPLQKMAMMRTRTTRRMRKMVILLLQMITMIVKIKLCLCLYRPLWLRLLPAAMTTPPPLETASPPPVSSYPDLQLLMMYVCTLFQSFLLWNFSNSVINLLLSIAQVSESAEEKSGAKKIRSWMWR